MQYVISCMARSTNCEDLLVPPQAAEVHALLEQARDDELLVRTADGLEFLLIAVDEFDREIARTRQNARLMHCSTKRAKQSKDGPVRRGQTTARPEYLSGNGAGPYGLKDVRSCSEECQADPGSEWRCPCSRGTFAMNAYSLADAWFVSRLGTKPLAAMAFTFPVIALLTFVGGRNRHRNHHAGTSDCNATMELAKR